MRPTRGGSEEPVAEQVALDYLAHLRELAERLEEGRGEYRKAYLDAVTYSIEWIEERLWDAGIEA